MGAAKSLNSALFGFLASVKLRFCLGSDQTLWKSSVVFVKIATNRYDVKMITPHGGFSGQMTRHQHTIKNHKWCKTDR